MTFIHIADLHANRERSRYCLSVLDKLIAKSKELNRPVVLFTGDFWDCTMTNTEKSGFTEYVKKVDELSESADVYFIYGTPFHEPSGSLDVFSRNCKVIKSNSIIKTEEYEIIAMPEPRKVNYGRDADKKIQSEYKEFIKSIPKEHDIQRIVMFHGEIYGARYQNGEKITSTSAIPISLLKEACADYYALGHIHEPQEVFDNAWYAGSSYPCNFGEKHDGCCNIVTIDKSVKVEKFSFGLPTNFKIECSFDEFMTTQRMWSEKQMANKNIKAIISIDKQQRKKININKLTDDILKKTKANSIVFKFNTTEEKKSIREKDITNKKNIKDKFLLWADLNNVTVTDDILSKLNTIEESMSNEIVVPNDSYELVSISLRGSIGIYDGQKKDEININFADYNDGVLVLTGDNGRGKTTLIENCHPFPKMLTRSGTLKDHFCLKDSHRILVYKKSDGSLIRISMFINGVNPNVSTRYLVETKKNGSDVWITNESMDGTLDSYKTWVKEIFGSVSMFIRTAFFTTNFTKDAPLLSSATKGEKMETFFSLAGIDYLLAFSKIAKEYTKSEKEKIEELKATIANYDFIVNEIKDTEAKLSEENDKYSKLKDTCEELSEKLAELERTQAKFDRISKETESARLRMIELNRSITYIEDDILNSKSLIEHYEEQSDGVESCKDKLSIAEENRKVIKEKESELRLLKNNLKTETTRKESISNDIMKIEIERDSLASQNDVLVEKIKNYDISDISDVCPNCGSRLSKDKIEKLEDELNKRKQIVNAINKTIKENNEKISSLTEDIIAKEEELNESNDNIDAINKDILSLENDITRLELENDEIDEANLMNIIQFVIPQINYEKSKISSWEKELASKKEELQTLKENTEELPQNKAGQLSLVRSQYSEEKSNLDTSKNMIDMYQEKIAKLNEDFSNIDSIEKEINKHELNIASYSVMAKAFSNEGIPALELDAAAPEISSVTNEILYDTYGDRFSVTFDTQRDAKDGRKIDDFIINVYDGLSGRDKTLDVLSKGETIWILQALNFAFSVVRANHTGFNFKIRFLDESDGSLDSGSRGMYLKMIQSAHKMCNARLTVLITHSLEISSICENHLPF